LAPPISNIETLTRTRPGRGRKNRATLT